MSHLRAELVAVFTSTSHVFLMAYFVQPLFKYIFFGYNCCPKFIDFVVEYIAYIYIQRFIRKSLRDFRPLRYSSRDGHAEGEHVNRGRETPNFCPTLQVLDIC